MSKIINNLSEFLTERGFGIDEPYNWARCFYKYTDCGPWAVFITRDEPAKVEKFSFVAARNSKGKLVAHTVADHKPLPPDEILNRFGFGQDGAIRASYAPKEIMRSISRYVAAVKDYREKLDSRDGIKITLTHEPRPENRSGGKRKWVLIAVERQVPETFNEVYYEDLRKEYPPVVNNENCAGIKIGSIVEGSEACYEHDAFMFPFDMAEFDAAIEEMEAETSFYWERDNSQWYKVQHGVETYYLHNAWGDIKWDCEKPAPDIVETVEDFLGTDAADEIPDEDSGPMTIPGTGMTILEWFNDTTF